MSCQHLQKHLCCGKMRADLQDADKIPSHCWSVGPGRTMLIFSASEFGDGFKYGLFFLICPYRRRCAWWCKSLHTLWKPDLAKGCHILQCEWRKATNRGSALFGMRSDEVSVWCVFILREPKSINQSSFSLTTPFVWKRCLSSSLAETLWRAQTSTRILFLPASLFLLLPLSENQSDAC